MAWFGSSGLVSAGTTPSVLSPGFCPDPPILAAAGEGSADPASLAGRLRAGRDLAQGGDHGDLGPVLRVQLGERLLVCRRLREARILHDGPTADVLLGLGVRPVDAGN